MARDRQSDEENEGLSPEQRLDSLEKAQKRNLIIFVILGIAAISFLTMKLTYLIIGDDEPTTQVLVEADPSDKNAQDKYVDVAQMARKIELLEQQLAAQKAFIQATSNEVLQQNLIDQEKSYQRFMVTLDDAIGELANMVPGSRTWLEVYTEEIEGIIARSKKRERALKAVRVELDTSSQEMDF